MMDDISDALHEHALMLARNLIRFQVCSIREVAETLNLEIPEVQQLTIEIYEERNRFITRLHQIMREIAEKPISRQRQETLLFEAIDILNRCLFRREPGRGEIADIRNWIRNMSEYDLALYLDKLYSGGNSSEILLHGEAFLDRVYAEFMRSHYDDLKKHDDDGASTDTCTRDDFSLDDDDDIEEDDPDE